MNGRFGKKMLVSTLRGSAAKQVLTARLNEFRPMDCLKTWLQTSFNSISMRWSLLAV